MYDSMEVLLAVLNINKLGIPASTSRVAKASHKGWRKTRRILSELRDYSLVNSYRAPYRSNCQSVLWLISDPGLQVLATIRGAAANMLI